MIDWSKQKNYIIDNVFTVEQVDYLHKIIDSSCINVVDAYNGRYLKGLDGRLRKDIMSRVQQVAKDATGYDLVPSDIGYSYYNNQYGKVELHPHIDKNKTEFVIDYQLHGNVEWPIVVEKKEFTLKDNQALVFAGSDQPHWRPQREFVDGEFLGMIFFHFIGPDHWTIVGGEDYKEKPEWIMKKEKAYQDYASYWNVGQSDFL